MTTETAGAVEVPTWQLDPTHSSVEFSVKHMMITTVRGRFKTISATLTGDEDSPEQPTAEATIDAASIDTGTPDRDAHLRSADFFDVERFPQITFRSKRIEGNRPKQAGDKFKLVGDLTIRDVTREVVLDCQYEGQGKDPWGQTRAGFTFNTEVNREDWGLRWNQVLETGGVLVSNKVRVEGELQFIKRSA